MRISVSTSRALPLFLLFFATAYGQQSDFHQQVITLYDFRPHELGRQQQQEKSNKLDTFWKMVESDKSKYLPLLTAELNDTNNPSFFFYDGSKLLLSLSQDTHDKMTALNAISRSDPRDLQLDDYLFTVHSLAVEGLDTSEAAFHILGYPKFHVIIPQHALTLGQDYSLICMVLPTKESFYLEKAIQRLKTEADATSQKSLLLLLWYSVTKEGDTAIKDFIHASNGAATAKAYASELLERNKNLKPSLLSFLKTRNIPDLKEQRKRAMARISDESLSELDSITTDIRAAYAKE